MAGLWILPFINVQVSTFLTNVELPYITHTCYSQYSTLSVCLSTMFSLRWKFFHPHTIVPSLTLFNETLYPRPFGDTFDTNESVPSLEPKAHDAIRSIWGSTLGAFFTLEFFFKSNIYLWETHHILIQNFKVIGVWVLPFINGQVSTFLINMKLHY